jgi:hypothetical protein
MYPRPPRAVARKRRPRWRSHDLRRGLHLADCDNRTQVSPLTDAFFSATDHSAAADRGREDSLSCARLSVWVAGAGSRVAVSFPIQSLHIQARPDPRCRAMF